VWPCMIGLAAGFGFAARFGLAGARKATAPETRCGRLMLGRAAPLRGGLDPAATRKHSASG
jgi:hypothetical protein